MKTQYIIISVVILFSLACGALAQMPPQPTQNAPTAFVEQMRPTATPYQIEVLGDDTTWNIREGASLEHPVIGIAYGGERFTVVSMYGGWVETDAGWICGQAFGASERCE